MGKIASFMLALSLVACGSNNKKKSPDAPVIDDAPIDARVCATETPSAPTFDYDDAPNMVIAWKADVPGGLDGKMLGMLYEFYGGGSSLQGTFDLTMGNQANYMTCEICVRAYTYDAAAPNMPIKWFYPFAGSVTFATDAYVSKHMMGSFTGLQLQEVTIASDYTSTPVPGGECGTYGSFSVDKDNVPAAWTCTHDKYQDGTTCDCMCGLQDPDCISDANSIVGCGTPTDRCYAGTCVPEPINDTCATAATLAISATPTNGTTKGAKHDYDTGLEGATCTAPMGFAQPGPDVAYLVTLTGGTTYTFTLTNTDPNFDPALALVGPGAATVCSATITQCVSGRDANGLGMGETFTYLVPGTGPQTYYLIVDSGLPDSAGDFTITVQ